MIVLIGVDPHKATNVVAAIDEGGKLIKLATFATNRAGLRLLERWGKRFKKRRWAVEGTGGLGCPAAQRLVATGARVVDVPPKLSARVRLLSAGNECKNDTHPSTAASTCSQIHRIGAYALSVSTDKQACKPL